MGHYIKKIIQEDKKLMPVVFSLAGNPNFAQFASIGDSNSESDGIDVKIEVLKSDIAPDVTKLEIEEVLTGIAHSFSGTKVKEDVDNLTFFLADSRDTIAENIRACLMKNSFFRSNFEITIPPVNEGRIAKAGHTLRIRSKGAGSHFCFRFITDTPVQNGFISLLGDPSISQSNDSIRVNEDSCDIELDIYEGTGLFPGEDDDLSLGRYITTLSKSYYGKPVWFDLNAIATDRKSFSTAFLNADNWCDAGTASDYRFVAKRFDGINREVFYMSHVCYVINGYERGLEQKDLSYYVYDTVRGNIIRPLTKQLEYTHIEGQKQYYNFILSDASRNTASATGTIGMLYKVYSQSGIHISDEIMSEIEVGSLGIVNTLPLRIDEVVKKYSNAGKVEIYLVHDSKMVSVPLVFRLLPACLYKVNDFAFLNSMGGWASFNFGGMRQTEFKTNKNTIFKTHIPEYDKTSDIESVIKKEVEEYFMVETTPIDITTADWLKEISTSVAVYELATKRYVIVDELNVKHNDKDDLFTLQMKYHYSDSYNGAV